MAVIAPYCRQQTGFAIDTTLGPPTGNDNMHFHVLDGAVESILNSETNHHGAGVPFNALGRLNTSPGSPITHHHNGLPFSSTGLLVTGAGPIDYYSQGVGFNAAGEVVTA